MTMRTSVPRSKTNIKIIILAVALWLVIGLLFLAFFLFGGFKLLMGNYQSIWVKAVYAQSPNDVWAIGIYYTSDKDSPFAKQCEHKVGHIATLHYTGTNWVPDILPVCGEVDSLVMTSATEGWAYSTLFEGPFLHYSAGKWDELGPLEGMTNTSSLSIHKLAMNSSNEGWMSGSDVESKLPLLFHYEQGQWHKQDNPLGYSIYYVSALSNGDAWAIASKTITATDTLLHYANGGWTAIEGAPVKRLNRVVAISSNEVWLLGYENNYSSIVSYKGGQWHKYEIVPTGTNPILSDISMFSSDSGWAVGFEGFGVQNSATSGPVVLRYDGNSWQHLNGPEESNGDLQQVSASSTDELWAIDMLGSIWHYKDGAWIQEYGQR